MSTTVTPDQPRYDMPESENMDLWGKTIEQFVFETLDDPISWDEIVADAQEERLVRVTAYAQESASNLIPNVTLHRKIDRLLDGEKTAGHDLLVMTAGRSPISVMLEDGE